MNVMEIVISVYECNAIVIMFLAMKFQFGLLNLSQDISILEIESINIDSLLDRCRTVNAYIL